MSTKVSERNFHAFSSICFFPGFPVPIEIKHLTSGFKSAVSRHQMLDASLSTSSTGLFAPNPPSTNVRGPILTGSKNLVAADVAKAASHIVGRVTVQAPPEGYNFSSALFPWFLRL
jgi:hypothetical protein